MISNLKYIATALFVASNLSINAMESKLDAGMDSPRTPTKETMNEKFTPFADLASLDSSVLNILSGKSTNNDSSSHTSDSSRSSTPVLSEEEQAAKDHATLESASDKKLEDTTEEE